jgi:hypothetical protein
MSKEVSKEVSKEEVNIILKNYINKGFNDFKNIKDSDEKSHFIFGIRLVETILSKNSIDDISDDIEPILGKLNYAERIPALLTILDSKSKLFTNSKLKNTLLKYRDDLVTINELCD